MDSVLRVLTVIWEFFVNNFLTQDKVPIVGVNSK